MEDEPERPQSTSLTAPSFYTSVRVPRWLPYPIPSVALGWLGS